MSSNSKSSVSIDSCGKAKSSSSEVLGRINRPIKFKCTSNIPVVEACRRRGWREVENDQNDWDLFWCDMTQLKDVLDASKIIPLAEQQRLSHFKNEYELSRKSLLVKNLKKYKKNLIKKWGKEEADNTDFFPTSFELPNEYFMFVEEFKRSPGSVWIVKPSGGCQGRGIFIFQKLKDLVEWANREFTPCGLSTNNNNSVSTNPLTSMSDIPCHIVQRYIENPYLIAGRKFDLRIYIMVPSFSPLKIWLYREGFTRFSGYKYNPTELNDIFAHLTNTSVQKTSADYNSESKSYKWSLRQVRLYLTARHGHAAVVKLLKTINRIIIESILSVSHLIIQEKHCFALYGYDILIDDKLKPWLLEINSAPALCATNEEDEILKNNLLNDILNILDLEGRFRFTGRESRVGGFDLIWNDGVIENEGQNHKCLLSEINKKASKNTLGSLNNREEQLQELLRISSK